MRNRLSIFGLAKGPIQIIGILPDVDYGAAGQIWLYVFSIVLLELIELLIWVQSHFEEASVDLWILRSIYLAHPTKGGATRVIGYVP